MDQHPIPRQITTFEFKLIGFMTLKQFLYLVVFVPSAFIVWKLVPIPLVNLILAALVAAGGVALAFVPINDRPMDVWIKNFFKRITSPTQYLYHKENARLEFLKDLYFVTDPHIVVAHVETQEKLNAYLQRTQAAKAADTQRQKQIQSLLKNPAAAAAVPQQPPQPRVVYSTTVLSPRQAAEPPVISQPVSQSTPQPVVSDLHQPFFTGVVKNNRKIPLPGVLVYIKDASGKPLRLLKSNPHGVFATFNPLPEGEYDVEMKDPNGNYFFDRMKVTIGPSSQTPYEFYSKEMI